jgi:hypothetical protein
MQLPIFPEGVTHITPVLAFSKQDGRVTYFNGSMPVFVHDEEDRASFQMITAQFCVNGNAKQADIVRAFGVTKISLKRAVKRYREEGPKGFYTPRKRRGAAVLTPRCWLRRSSFSMRAWSPRKWPIDWVSNAIPSPRRCVRGGYTSR